MTGGFRHLGDDVAYHGYAMDVVVARFAAPDGSEFTRDVIRHVGAVAALPLHDDGTVTLVRQYRGALDREVLEIPAGLRDISDEPLEVTAARELAEEVGLEAASIEPLCAFHNAVGLSDEEVHIFLATGLTPVPAAADGVEEQHMEILRVPLDRLIAMIAAGEVTDAKTIIGALVAAQR